MIKEKSAGILIFFLDAQQTPQYLLLHYPLGHWDFPKGHVEQNETLEETALRELEEETGISKNQIAIISGFEQSLSYSYNHSGKKFFKEVTFFLAKTQTQTVKISREHINFTWLPFELAYSKLTYENAKNILEKAHIFLKQKFSQKKLEQF
ncbi:MAG: bis(5'-nucleosyl)-tetraphosphatase [Candidatus Diapherotrites archaeon]|nr:bis(5'-nucleosyl)-tetraphosphatase [Candidatus Diapherotrites archaeon]